MRININNKVFLGTLLSLFLLFEGVAAAQIASALIREGEALPGDTLGSSITEIGNTAQNGVGGYSFSVTTDSSFSHVWGHATGGTGTVMRSEDTHGDYVQTSFESFFGMSDSGSIGYSAIADDISGTPSGLDGLWIDDFRLISEEEPINELIGKWATFFDRPGMTTNGVPYWLGGYSDNPGGPNENVAIFRSTGSNILFKGGDFIAGINLNAIIGDAVDFNIRFSGLGTRYIAPVTVTPASVFDDVVIVSNGVAKSAGGSFIREDTNIPASVGGGPGEKYDTFDYLGITESGSYMITGDTTALSSEDEIVLVDDLIVLREGDDIGGLTLNGEIEGGSLNEDGDWAVIWDVDTAGELGGNVEALIVNGSIVLLEGATVDWNGDGVIDGADNNAFLTDFTGDSTLTMGPRDGNDKVNVCFTADCDVNGSILEGGFIVSVDLSGTVIVNVDSFEVTRGDYVSGTVADLADSDNNDVSARRNISDLQSRVTVEFKSTSPTATPSVFDFTFEASVFGRTTIVQSLDLYNYQTDMWEEVDTRNAQRLVDLVTVVSPGGDLSRFVQPGTLCIEARVRFESLAARQRFAANIDQVIWTITP